MFMQLYKIGYIAIPLVGKNPAPGVSGWGRWATDGIDEDTVERFEKSYPLEKYGVGLVCGPASNNLIAVDCDSIAPDVAALVPRSPLVRVGMRGSASFFTNNENIQSCKFFRPNKHLFDDPSGKDDEGIEVRGRGLYMAIPPTVHPETKKRYTWTGGHSIENFDPVNIPPLLAADVRGFSSISASEGKPKLAGVFTKSDGTRCPHGSHDRLKSLASALIGKGTPLEAAVAELLKYDNDHHKPTGYFSDRSRGECRADPYTNAARFYAGIMSTHNGKRVISGEAPQVPTIAPTVSVANVKPQREERAIRPSYPELPGLLGMFSSGILHKTRREQPGLAIGGALALGSVLCAHRFSIGGELAHTRLYIMNVGKTGSGKDAPFKFISGILSHPEMRGQRLLGFENYSSKAAILETLTEQKVRLDLRDEFKDTFISINNNVGATGNEISSFLNKHFTDSGWFGGHYTQTRGFTGACRDPSISLLAGIQNEELASCMSGSNISDGLLGRFMYFFAEDGGGYVGRQKNAMGGILDACVAEIKRVLPPLRYAERDVFGNTIDAEHRSPMLHPIERSSDYISAYEDYDADLARREDELERSGDEAARALLTRRIMFIERVSIIIAVCNEERTLTREHLELAIKIVCIGMDGVLKVISRSTDTVLDRDIRAVLALIKSGGFASRGVISARTKRNKREMQDLIDTMIERDLIEERTASEPAANGKSVTVYTAL